MTDLSLVIVNWNTCHMLADCLDSLTLDKANDNLTMETIVVDNASVDASSDMVRERFPGVVLIENSTNVGFARANNQAMAIAQGRLVVLLNSDTVVRSGALDALVRFMDDNPQAGACGPRLLNEDGSLQASCHPMLTPFREFWRLSFLDRLLPLATYRQERWPADGPRQVEVIKGACMVLRRKALEQVGFLDDRYFMYTEEMDLCLRLTQAGWTLYYVPMAEIVHYGEASSRQVAARMYIELYRSKAQFHAKFGGHKAVIWFKWLIAVAYVPRCIALAAGSLFSRRLADRARTCWRLLVSLPGM